jgi:aminopeptidase-like protein
MDLNFSKTDFGKMGQEMKELITELYPICRSITGKGVRETLEIVKQHIPIESFNVASGTEVFDWSVPEEWNIKEAYIKGPDGNTIVNFKDSNLHIVNYSIPVDKKIPLKELKKHLHTLPEHRDWVPYKTSYYEKAWGFCLSHKQYESLKDGMYHVVIRSTLTKGHLTCGEYILPGKKTDTVLLSTHICHPSLCNDNLSGIVLMTWLAKILRDDSLNYTFRFLFIPGTIGAITWLALNEEFTERIKHGLVISCVGDKGHICYKKSRRQNADIDRIAQYVLKAETENHEIFNFSPYGYDERQFCSPGFNLPVGAFTRSANGKYKEYHTSADNLGFVKANALADSLEKCLKILQVVEREKTFINKNGKCEPQLGKRGLYSSLGGSKNQKTNQMAMLWILNLSDGGHSLLDIAEMSQIDFDIIYNVSLILENHGLLECTK